MWFLICSSTYSLIPGLHHPRIYGSPVPPTGLFQRDGFGIRDNQNHADSLGTPLPSCNCGLYVSGQFATAMIRLHHHKAQSHGSRIRPRSQDDLLRNNLALVVRVNTQKIHGAMRFWLISFVCAGSGVGKNHSHHQRPFASDSAYCRASSVSQPCSALISQNGVVFHCHALLSGYQLNEWPRPGNNPLRHNGLRGVGINRQGVAVIASRPAKMLPVVLKLIASPVRWRLPVLHQQRGAPAPDTFPR